MLKAKGYRFFNIPRGYGIEDYKETVGCIIKKYSEIDNLISVYNWGDISIPGISDIDIVFVFKDNASKPLPLLKRSFYFLDAKTRYLMRHPFIFIGENSFQNIRFVYPNASLKLAYGKNIKIGGISSSDDYYSRIALLSDIIIRHYPRDFIGQLVNKKIDVRGTLLRLNSLKYSIGIFEGLAKEKMKWDAKLGQIERLRNGWFKANDFDLLVLLVEDAVHIAMDIIEKFRLFLTDKGLIKISSGSDVKYYGMKNISLFIKNWDKERALQEMRDKHGFCSVLPIETAAQLAEYSKYNGPISSYIRKNIDGSLNYQLAYKNIIKERIDILNKQAELALRLKHSDFAAYFDFGYRNSSGINNWILGLLDRIRF